MSSAREESPAWLLLITNLPGRNQTLRMRLWRGLKAAGAGLLKDGVYLLPNSSASRQLFEDVVRDIGAAKGNAYVVESQAQTAEQESVFRSLFDRTDEYRELLERLASEQRQFRNLTEADARQKLASVRRELSALVARDFFPGKPHQQAEAALADAEQALNRRFSPDEPFGGSGEIPRKEIAKYRGRTWATRERMWIDRVACAWLIRRFVDRRAKFVWLKRTTDCPKKAVGFDFQGAEFTHVGSKVTFEVILMSFGLEHDGGLSRLAALVHYLDVGGVPVPDAAGFSSIMAGARVLRSNDDELLKAMAPVLDSLYAGYAQSEPNNDG